MVDFFFWRKRREEERDLATTGDQTNLIASDPKKRSNKLGFRSLMLGNRIDPEQFESLEDLLIAADFGLTNAEQIVSELKSSSKGKAFSSETELRTALKNIIAEKLSSSNRQLNFTSGDLPYVVLVVGVNGAGKTTSIGKLAKWLSESSWKIVIGAADTFRAAAVDQLRTWANRTNSHFVEPKLSGQDPASVAFEAVESAIASDADICLIDTAGRLQNKADLMNELEKIRRVIEKRATIAEVLLVIDATTGQNGISQAKAFAESAKVTGIILTKLDGSAKGGVAFAIERELGIPIKLVGVGEGAEDLAVFDPEEFAAALVA